MDTFTSSQPSTSYAETNEGMTEGDESQAHALELKFKYISLLERANEIAGNQNFRESMVQIDNVIDKAVEIFPQVKDASAMFMDAKLFHSTTAALEQTTDNIDVGEGIFRLLVFAEHIKMKAMDSEGKPHWQVLVGVAPPVVPNSLPYWSPLLGSFDLSPNVNQHKERNVRRHLNEVVAEKKEPSKDPQGMNVQEGVEKVVQRVFEKLKKHYKVNKNPINYFRFVVNPNSFSDTVENIFHVSFLINDGHARIEMVDGHPMISPTEDKENTNHNAPLREKERKQMIMPMDMELWEALILMLDIKTAMI